MNRSNMNRSAGNTSLKPEYVLKRVNDLINSAVGNSTKEKKVALEQLHGVIGVKKKITFSKVYETLMKKHLELCVELKDHLTAKDGLHQYRNLCQTVDPNSLEIIILYLMELAEDRATAARQKADKVALAAAAKVADLDQGETPESVMLSSMTEAGAKGRTDREVVVPWLKFLWESYRAILELLYKIPKLERVYHKTCEKAFKFCLDYTRVMEFRRLCEMLRIQLANLQKTPAAGARSRIQWEWTAEAVEYHLQTRFAQLEVATSLELWNEGFRTVEDIYAIMVAGKKTPKPKLMMTYYDKLTRIFWVSDNKLFHAYAWYRYYCLCTESKKELKGEEKSILASSVLLSALTVPSVKDIYSVTDDEEDVVVNKSSQMALLLDFQVNPSRQTLLSDIFAKGVIKDVIPELAMLYDNLELKFEPLNLIKNIAKAIDLVKTHPSLSMYSKPLQRLAVIKLMQQLARVYSTVKLTFVYKLLAGLNDLSPTDIESILIDATANKQLQLRVDHYHGTVHFNIAATSVNAVDSQAASLGKQLNSVCHSISLLLGQKELEDKKSTVRSAFLSKVAAAAEADYQRSLDRKAEIERRKEGLERLQQERQKEERRVRDVEEANRIKEEQERLQAEEEQRNYEKRKKLMEKMELVRVQKELERHGVFMEESAIAELDNSSRQALITDAQNEALKAKDEENRKLSEQAKRLDHIVRAMRIEAAEAIQRKYAAQLEEDRAAHNEKIAGMEVTNREKHATDLVEKTRLARMQALRGNFEKDMLVQQSKAYDYHISKIRSRAEKDRLVQVVARARRLYDEEMERIEAEEERERERIAKIERDRLEREQHERLRALREAEEAAERERERLKQEAREREQRELREKREKEEAERQAKEEEEKAKAHVYRPPRPAAAASSAVASGWGRTSDREKESSNSGGGSSGGWERSGPVRGSGGDRGADRGAGGGGGDSWGGRFDRSGGGDREERGGGGDRGADRGAGGGGDSSWGRGGGASRAASSRSGDGWGRDSGGGGGGGGSRDDRRDDRGDRGDRREYNRDRDRDSGRGGDGGDSGGWKRGSGGGSNRGGGSDRNSSSSNATNNRAGSRW